MAEHMRPEVAVIGVGCWYPGAHDAKTLWQNILARRQQFREFPHVRLPLADYHSPDRSAPEKTYGRRGAFIDGFEFDWARRRIPKTVVDSTDIAHWLALEVALQAVADAGYEPGALPQERTSVLVGNTLTGEHTRSNAMRQRWPFVRRALLAAARDLVPAGQLHELSARMEALYKSPLAPTTEDTLAGGLSNTIAGRICNFMNLGGGGYTVDGACSSSLIAVANAAAAVAGGEADVAIAGGVDISLDTFELIGFAKTGALTAGDMNVYDQGGQGFVPGEGCGFVVLKDYARAIADGDKVYAVVRGWGISSDGKGGITAPKASGQALALSRAYARAGYGVRDLDFIEGHGTGTAVGDRTELQGIALAAQDQGELPARKVGLTSFKSLVGHTKAAAGIGGFIKAVLAVNQRVIPPTVGCHVPHPAFDQEARGLYPVREGEARPKSDALRAAVSGMGFGGINCHVTLESAGEPAQLLPDGLDEDMLLASAQDAEVFLFSAASPALLAGRVREVAGQGAGICVAELADLAAHVNAAIAPAGQRPWRAAVVAASPDDLAAKLVQLLRALEQGLPASGLQQIGPDVVAGRAGAPRVGFLFPGQGSQQINMARALARRHPWAREMLGRADAVLAQHGFAPVSQTMLRRMDRAFNTPVATEWVEQLKDTRNAQVAICVASALWTAHLQRLGLRPAVVAGHSLGELSALYAAGAVGFEDLVRLSAERGQAMASQGERPGAMLSLACDEAGARELLAGVQGYAVVACANAPRQTVVAGDAAAVAAVAALATARAIGNRELQVSNAFHSELVAHAGRQLAALEWLPGQAALRIPFVSSVDTRVHDGSIELRAYCAQQVTAPVRFCDMVRQLPRLCDVVVEVGPGRALCGMVNETLAESAPACLPVESRSGSQTDFARATAVLFTTGCEIDAVVLHEDRLVRPFIAASARRFIDNPCERPMSLDGVVVAPRDLPSAPPLREPPAAASQPLREQEAGTVLQQLRAFIAQQTGFAAASLGPGLRLLDDLNLDSIKAGDLLARMAANLGAVGKVDPAPLLNATLAEIASALEGVGEPVPAAAQASADHAGRPYASLLRRVAERTGFEPSSLHPGLRMVDDLNLDSIKVGELVAQTAREFGALGKVDPVQLANATLAEIAQRIEAAASLGAATEAGEAARAPAQPAAAAAGWVRDFSLEWVKEAAPAESEAGLRGARLLVVAAGDRASALAGELQARGADVQLASPDAFEGMLADASFSGAVFVVNASMDADKPALVRLLRGSAMQASPPLHGGGRRSLAYVLLGEVAGVHGFAASLHLERSDLAVRVLQFPQACAARVVGEALARELGSQAPFTSAAFDGDATRKVARMRLNAPAAYADRGIAWEPGDVVLATGGGKGITAECAVALAREHGVRLALVGSTDFGTEAPQGEVGATLARLRELGTRASYYACDVSRRDAVDALLARVQAELGPVAAVLHGAGANKPRRAQTVDAAQALQEIAPKMEGARHLMQALQGTRLKAFCALTSIIGFTGMPGNAWYAFSNACVDRMVEDYGRLHPGTACFTVAYSVWDEVGMGARMGSVGRLGSMGIAPIPPQGGVDHFLRLWRRAAPTPATVVAARLGGLDTWSRADEGAALQLRFVQELVALEPGVELVARTLLHPAHDPYLTDHNYRGSLLFPTVFGMEAMAQAAARLLGSLHPFAPGAAVRFESLRLDRPIVVNPESGTWIELRAVAGEPQADGTVPVRVSLHSELSGWQPAHFSATLVLGGGVGVPSAVARGQWPPALALQPQRDLYGPLLFQGSRFQRIEAVRHLASLGEFRGEALLDIRGDAGQANDRLSFAEAAPWQLLLGDPFERDAMLQSGQLLIPQHMCLPIAIDSVTIRLHAAGPGLRRLRTQLHGRDGRDVTASCALHDEQGTPLQEMRGYRVRIVDEMPGHPTLAQLAGLHAWDAGRQAAVLRKALAAAGFTGVHAALWSTPGIHGWSRAQRREHVRPLVGAALQDFIGDGTAQLSWRSSGQPILEGSPCGISISHDDEACLVALRGSEGVGCDLAPVGARSRAGWLDLLGPAAGTLLEELVAAGDGLDLAGARLWAAREVLVKLGVQDEPVWQVAADGDGWRVLQDQGRATQARVLTVALQAWGGGCRVAAVGLALPTAQPSPQPAAVVAAGPEEFRQLVQARVTRDAGGVMHLHHQFPMLLEDASTLERRVSVSRYFGWMGKLRELSLLQVMQRFARTAESGRWGSVTSTSDVAVYDELRGDDHLLGDMYAIRLPDSDDATMDLAFDWFRVRAGGAPTLVASSAMRMTWVEILGHGHVAKRPLPPFMRDFFNDMGERPIAAWTPESVGYAAMDAGRLVASYEATFGAAPLLHHESFQTDQEDSNLIGNVYQSNYARWMCRTRDRYFHTLDPDYFKGNGPRGEWRCVRSRIHHLRDAMPFDTIQVDMHLARLCEHTAVLGFSVFRCDPGGGRIKLAQGDQELLWAREDERGGAGAAAIPSRWLAAMSAHGTAQALAPAPSMAFAK